MSGGFKMALQASGILLAHVLLTTGCSGYYKVHDPVVPLTPITPLASEVVLEVDDQAVNPAFGQLGHGLKAAFIKNKIFGQVCYPDAPGYSVPIKIRVKGRGDVDTENKKAEMMFGTGPLPVLLGLSKYRDTFIIEAEVVITRDTQSFQPFVVKTTVDAIHTPFETPLEYAPSALELAFDDLVNRIYSYLRQHPEWLSP